MVTQQHQPNPGPSRLDVRGFNQDRSAPGPAGFQPKNMAPVPVSVIGTTSNKVYNRLCLG